MSNKATVRSSQLSTRGVEAGIFTVRASDLRRFPGHELFADWDEKRIGWYRIISVKTRKGLIEIEAGTPGEYFTARRRETFQIRRCQDHAITLNAIAVRRGETGSSGRRARPAAVKSILPGGCLMDRKRNFVRATMTERYIVKALSMIEEFLDRMSPVGGWPGATDTYKRTMWTGLPEAALADAAYSLTLRKPLPEDGAGNQLVMAGHEAMLAQVFHRPYKRSDIELYAQWSANEGNVRAYPRELWEAILTSQRGEDIYLPIDVWGFPGGQTFLAGVPCMSFEGMGGIVSYIEPAMCRYFAPIIQATKARLMKMATNRDAEFGLRAAVNEISNLVLLLARLVGGGGFLTSNDSAEFMWSELLKAIGTLGHEAMCSAQSFEKSLSDAEFEVMDKYVTAMGSASLLCDLVDAETVGLENALRVITKHTETNKVGIRVDSGDIRKQCVTYFLRMKERGIPPRTIVFEDEVSPTTVKKVYDFFKAETGEEPTMLFPGAGGYWWRLVHRDTVSAAFKRTWTGENPNVKFSNSEGKESICGRIRVYGRGDKMIIADKSETIDGEPLFVQLVKNGRIVYHESFADQGARAEATWGHYTTFEFSPLIAEWMERFRGMRREEVSAARNQI